MKTVAARFELLVGQALVWVKSDEDRSPRARKPERRSPTRRDSSTKKIRAGSETGAPVPPK
jgi:hypothetical protein